MRPEENCLALLKLYQEAAAFCVLEKIGVMCLCDTQVQKAWPAHSRYTGVTASSLESDKGYPWSLTQQPRGVLGLS